MYFDTKSYLKSTRNYIVKHYLNVLLINELTIKNDSISFMCNSLLLEIMSCFFPTRSISYEFYIDAKELLAPLNMLLVN